MKYKRSRPEVSIDDSVSRCHAEGFNERFKSLLLFTLPYSYQIIRERMIPSMKLILRRRASWSNESNCFKVYFDLNWRQRQISTGWPMVCSQVTVKRGVRRSWKQISFFLIESQQNFIRQTKHNINPFDHNFKYHKIHFKSIKFKIQNSKNYIDT